MMMTEPVLDAATKSSIKMAYQRHKAPVVEMVPNKERILEAILCLLNAASARSKRLTQYDIVKSMFLADRGHINKYGRPITFDNYVAMKHGPVPSFVYDILKDNAKFVRAYGDSGMPWTRVTAPGYSNGTFHFIEPARQPDMDVLSESDVDALTDALAMVLSLSFGQIRKLTHDDPAYMDAWEEESDGGCFPISYGLLFDVPNFDLARDLAFLSGHI
jgi:hypothetical protein